MAYTPYYPGGWQSGAEGNTPITPAALNNMESGITSANAVDTVYLGSFATLAALGDALTTELQFLETDEHIGIRFSMSSAVAPFAAATYVGTLYKGGISNVYSNLEVFRLGINLKIIGALSNSTWSFIEMRDKVRLDIPANGTVTFTIGTSANPYGTCFVITSGYNADTQGMYILTRSSQTLIKTAVKDASKMAITMDSAGVVTIVNSHTSTAYAVVFPIIAVSFN